MSSQPSLEGKTDRYRRFWTRSPVERPLIGFSVGGWFPLQSYRAMQKLRGEPILRPDDLHPEEFLPDYEGIVALWDGLEDDMIRGLAPLPPFPWLEAMLGCRVQIGNESVWAEEGGFLRLAKPPLVLYPTQSRELLEERTELSALPTSQGGNGGA